MGSPAADTAHLKSTDSSLDSLLDNSEFRDNDVFVTAIEKKGDQCKSLSSSPDHRSQSQHVVQHQLCARSARPPLTVSFPDYRLCV